MAVSNETRVIRAARHNEPSPKHFYTLKARLDMSPTSLQNTSRRTLLVALALGTLTAGCAALQSPEESLKERAQAYWNAKKINDALSAYKYEDISLQAEQNVQNYAKRTSSIEYRVAEVKGVKLTSANEGEVTVDLSYTLPGTIITKPISTSIRDYWIEIDGQWYRSKPIEKKPSQETAPK